MWNLFFGEDEEEQEISTSFEETNQSNSENTKVRFSNPVVLKRKLESNPTIRIRK